ncbi:hypothetical protein KR044_009169 [Drosophila immigrans]|nr:hypothetical protein KR044_009169 [Drosophila immigrans]
MLRQLQLRAPVKAVQFNRSLTYNSKQLQPLKLIDVLKQEQESKLQSKPQHPNNLEQLMVKMSPVVKPVKMTPITRADSNAIVGCYNMARREMPIASGIHKQHIKRQYSVCPNPYEQLQLPLPLDEGKMPRSASDRQSPPINSSAVALVPLDHSQLDQKKPQPQTKMPEQPVRKVPHYNPLRRRSNVDPARVQYIKDRFKERNTETDTNKPQAKKYVSRTTLHSGRLDKID